MGKDIAGFTQKWHQKVQTQICILTNSHVYTEEQFEDYKTHDALWNAAQMQVRTIHNNHSSSKLVHHGKMAGFMRMYWAKKILEWTPSAQEGLTSWILSYEKSSTQDIHLLEWQVLAWWPWPKWVCWMRLVYWRGARPRLEGEANFWESPLYELWWV